ncbi:transposase [Caballeronia sp. Lep1P3]|uniref:transposase n=1 Tax=Caballeronia sp. Lep1P3 TaxID=2878150 RepID=UPI001FD07383|nr:transposase [Caballeronia sp. Lep1P3]
MNSLMPWSRLRAIVEPHVPKDSAAPFPAALEPMLRVCFLQSWFGLSDRDCEDALIDSIAMRRFARIDETGGCTPDANAMGQFRRFLQSHALGQPVLAEVNRALAANGIRIKTGVTANARILAAISSDAPESAAHRDAAGTRRQSASPDFGSAYSVKSMRFRVALDVDDGSARAKARDASRVEQAIANVQRTAERAIRPARRNSGSR